ncbi:hypothetical protein [Roseospira marina]|nr:hypothetical protein [Roseospira marina]MBB4313302.1 hypothetical protein [Roseospira marina]MBB5085957.1 hypothetical protein [Roseospira marina]
MCYRSDTEGAGALGALVTEIFGAAGVAVVFRPADTVEAALAWLATQP